ncbi:MAG TPA: ABC transporter substrate-binding protein, partial [Marinobacter adhaerens]|nr:ABC transporter substrate-binding protein [Marinobacter adhaerens]
MARPHKNLKTSQARMTGMRVFATAVLMALVFPV